MTVLEDEPHFPGATDGSRPRSRAALTTSGDGQEFRLTGGLWRTQRVRLTRDLLRPDNALLRDSVDGRPALVVMSPSVQHLYGRGIRAYFEAAQHLAGTHFMVLNRSEPLKSLAGVLEVCEHATAAGLLRTSPIVAIGGGVCSDICGLAASLHRRGIPHINVPTTLIGLVDAGIGAKNAVNHAGRKSALGSFHPPEHTLLDPGFLASLPRRHLVSGMAEIAKLAIVRDPRLFTLLCEHGSALVETTFRQPAAAADEVIRRAVGGMLAELSQNPYEVGDLQRTVDFGHTFSPYIEVSSRHAILHGEAVAMDIALSARIAHELGVLDGGDLDRILGLLSYLGLSQSWAGVSVEGLSASLASIIQHRDDELHLVVPTGIGRCTFLRRTDINQRLLAQCIQQTSVAAARCGSEHTPRRSRCREGS